MNYFNQNNKFHLLVLFSFKISLLNIYFNFRFFYECFKTNYVIFD